MNPNKERVTLPYPLTREPAEGPAHQMDYATANHYYGANVRCNRVQTYQPQVGLYGEPPKAGTSIRGSSFFAKYGVRSFRTEQGFKDRLGVPGHTEMWSARSAGLYTYRKDSSRRAISEPERDCYLATFRQPDPKDPRFGVPRAFLTSYKDEFLPPNTHRAPPAGKSWFRIG